MAERFRRAFKLGHAINRRTFDRSVQTQLAPSVSRGDVAILGNPAAYQSQTAAECPNDHGAWLL
tara:strand:+ start:43296 stop:43487 length:192 start_codon:yes stop_codon:yes gene_type:complete